MRTASVYIRIIESSDIPRTHEWINDIEISEIMGYLPITLEHQENWYRSTVGNDKKFIFAICDQSDDSHIGNVGLGNIDYINRTAMLSIFIGDKERRGKGIGPQATILALDFAFFRLNLHKVFLKTSDYLKDAISMYTKIGFVKEGELRQHEFKSGRYVNKLIFGMLYEEYVARYRPASEE